LLELFSDRDNNSEEGNNSQTVKPVIEQAFVLPRLVFDFSLKPLNKLQDEKHISSLLSNHNYLPSSTEQGQADSRRQKVLDLKKKEKKRRLQHITQWQTVCLLRGSFTSTAVPCPRLRDIT